MKRSATHTDEQIRELFEQGAIDASTYRGAILVPSQHGSLGRRLRRECRKRCAEVLAQEANSIRGWSNTCALCEADFRRVGGIHIGSQRLKMICDKPCQRVGVAVDQRADVRRRWVAYVDGALLRTKDDEIKHWATAAAAVNAARKTAPRSWHP